jgi:chromosome segregation ATPase
MSLTAPNLVNHTSFTPFIHTHTHTYLISMDICEERREQFEAKQSKMRDQVLKFEKYIQENDAKRQRADMKAKQEHKMYEEKCRELENIHRQIAQLKEDELVLEKELDNKSRFTFYLETVLESTDGFEEVSDLLKRYYTLKQSNVELMSQVQAQDKDLDLISSQLDSLRVDQENQLLVNNSFLQSQQKKLEHALTAGKHAEEEKNRIEDMVKNVSKEVSQVAQSIKNIYNRCQSTMRTPGKESSNNSVKMAILAGNLDLMESRLVDLIEITDEYRMVGPGSEADGNIVGEGLNAGSNSTVTGMPSGVLGGASTAK